MNKDKYVKIQELCDEIYDMGYKHGQDDGQAQLTEAKKPKLRHLDYGTNPDKSLFLYANRNGVIELFGFKQGSGTPIYKAFNGHTLLGNLADDIAAHSEPLEEFEMDTNKVFINTFRNIQIESNLVGGGYVIINKEVFHDFNLKCRQVEATLKAKQ